MQRIFLGVKGRWPLARSSGETLVVRSTKSPRLRAETEKCSAFFSGSRVVDPCAVQLRKLVARSAKSPPGAVQTAQ